MAASHSVPLYVGRILSPSGVPQGTCFQLAPGYLVTAWHVVQATLALGDDEVLRVDRLSNPGSGRITARVVTDDRRADLALLKADAPFPESARLLRGARAVRPSEPVTVVGHALIHEADDRPYVLFRLLAEGAGHQKSDQAHHYAAEPVFALAFPGCRLRSGFGQPVAHGAPRAFADDFAVEVNDAAFRDVVQVCRFPAGDGLGALDLLLPHLHHDARLGAELPVLPVQRLVQHQATQPLRQVCRVGEELGHYLPRQGDLCRDGALHGVSLFSLWQGTT
ncbi:serine protease [Streptomyces sp. NPDC058595]|uniref:S1 family peptidase n=1 Tax=Streptomyces sp. NPDC058595 TaxID=3346550 RepID=UPI0036636AB1